MKELELDPERSPDGTGEAASSMVGATLPAAPSVRIAKSRQFSMPKRAIKQQQNGKRQNL